MTTYEAMVDLPFIPKWMGYPFYPCGFPVQADAHTITTEAGGTASSIQQRIRLYYETCINNDGDLIADPPLSRDEFEVLRQWLIYYLHAPIWASFELEEFSALLEKAVAMTTWNQLHDVAWAALDFGLDPL